MAPPKDAKMCFQMEIDDIECIFPGLLSIYFGVVIWSKEVGKQYFRVTDK